ncbi:MAG: hypothetical protein GF317_17440 [Candidatus Lokiarchaeota archaeon]|nr:hypothetical protein [Candidatus Lokiarchaeota archaeon]MBD3201306.1 hypothetical protein [Candidatus Lokiarchaeota archaeon]
MSKVADISSKIKSLLCIENEKFEDVLEKFYRAILTFLEEIEEFREEIVDYDDIYQFEVEDIGFYFWISVNNEEIVFERGVNKNYDIKFILSKPLVLKVITKELEGFDAYMRGLIKAKGPLEYALRFKNFLKQIIIYITYFIEKKK